MSERDFDKRFPLAGSKETFPNSRENDSCPPPCENQGIRHIAIIMDGNRRWARQNNLPTSAGHRAGAKVLREITAYCQKRHILYLTVYAFSTENWNRSKEEVSFLFDLFLTVIKTELPDMIKAGVRLDFIGDLQALSFPVRSALEYAKAKTAFNSSIQLTIALNYSGKKEILNAVSLAKKSGIQPEELSEEKFRSVLYKSDLPDPDIIIRTGGEERLSNFLLYQSVHAYFYTTKELWPEFNEQSLKLAIDLMHKKSVCFQNNV